MSEYLQKYNDIMKKYYRGEFGGTHLTMHDILYRAEEPDLFDNQQIDEEEKEPTPSKETLDVSSLEDVDFGDEEQETGTLKS